MANKTLQSFTIDGTTYDVPILGAGDNITITDGDINVKTSPAFTGTPTAPTNPTASTSNTQIATTEFVQNAIGRRIPNNLSYKGEGAFSVPNATQVSKNMLTVPATGIYLMTLYVSYAANATGKRTLHAYIDGEPVGAGLELQACSSGVTVMTLIAMNSANAGQTLQARVYQSSGATLNANFVVALGLFIPN